ncbi:winged helix-turn-helix domain-containing protein [Pseudomonas sp. CCNWLW23]|uniref:winged helix-turn-helix domain-containing protein n=1 Tax=Pseudomonas sp. CCNWLW23 TaxID=3126385 RepID=UPI003012A79E
MKTESELNKEKIFYLKTGSKDTFIIFASDSLEYTIIQSGLRIRSANIGYATARILETLLTSPDTIIDREIIIATAWPGRVVTQNSLNQSISALRQIFEDGDSVIIKTVSRRGYLFNAGYIANKKDLQLINEEQVDSEDNFHDILPETRTNPRSNTPTTKSTSLNGKFDLTSHGAVSALILLTALTSIIFFIKIFYTWEEGLWYATRNVKIGGSEILYVAEDDSAIDTIQSVTKATIQKFIHLSNDRTFVLVNKMHSYIDFICMSNPTTPKFILAHESALDSITEKHIEDCLN